MGGWKIAFLILCAGFAGCKDDRPAAPSTLENPVLLQCARDIDCKGDRICENGRCQAPNATQAISSSGPTLEVIPPKPPSVLGMVISPEVIGSTLEYFEKNTGPAKERFGDERTYLVEGCEVLTVIKEGEIRAVGINLNQKCSLNLNAFLPNFDGKFPAANKLTMPIFQNIVGQGVEYFVPCFDCGTSMDPITYAHWIGSRADQVLEVRLETEAVPDKVDAAMEQESFDFDFNCKPNKLEPLARAAPPVGQIQSILIGHGLPLEPCRK